MRILPIDEPDLFEGIQRKRSLWFAGMPFLAIGSLVRSRSDPSNPERSRMNRKNPENPGTSTQPHGIKQLSHESPTRNAIR